MQKKKRRGSRNSANVKIRRLRLDGETVRQLGARDLDLAIAGVCNGASIHTKLLDPGCEG
jgi:hypothetical protein